MDTNENEALAKHLALQSKNQAWITFQQRFYRKYRYNATISDFNDFMKDYRTFDEWCSKNEYQLC